MRIALRFGTIALLIAIMASPAAAVTPTGRLQIIHLDVGQGDGAVIISPLGDVAVIDNGPSGSNAMGVSVVGQLQALGVTRIDHHFVSHYHSDHLGNTANIVNAGISIARGWDRGGSYTTGAYTSYVSALGANRRTIVRNQVVTLDSLSAHPVTITCVNLAGAGLYSGSEENNLSLILKVSYGEFDAVFGGDLAGTTSGSYKDIETTVGPQVGPVEVYKVHHHGSSTSGNAAWLSAIQPQIGVISLGNGNSYGHPTASAMTRLHAANVRTYWTELGTGAAPLAGWDKVANGQVIISATWEPAGVDTVRGNGFADTFTNSGTPGDVIAPIATLYTPNGYETWTTGSVQDILWTATDNIGVTAVDLAYSTDGGATYFNVIATGLPNTGSYLWTIPAWGSSAVRILVTAHDAAGLTGSDDSDADFEIFSPLSAADPLGGLASALSVYPNPASSGTANILYGISQSMRVDVSIYDAAGRLVRRIESGTFGGGERTARWDGRDENGRAAPSGIYLVRLVTGSGVQETKRLVLFR